MNSSAINSPRENLNALEDVEKADVYKYLVTDFNFTKYTNWADYILKTSVILSPLITEFTKDKLFVSIDKHWKTWTPFIDKEGLTAYWVKNFSELAFSPANYLTIPTPLNIPLSDLPIISEHSPNQLMHNRNALAFGGSPTRESIRSYQCAVLPQPYLRSNYVANEPETETSSEVQSLQLNQSAAQLVNEDEILNFSGDPDDDGFVPYKKATVDRAKEFLSAYAGAGVERSFSPKVLPGPNGSIDIHWKNKKRELLVNIPADPEKPATFYGDDFGDVNISGSAHVGKIEEFIAYWLAS
jgi:hypothetical protein